MNSIRIWFTLVLVGCASQAPARVLPCAPCAAFASKPAPDPVVAAANEKSAEAPKSAPPYTAELALASPHPKIDRATAKKLARRVLASAEIVEVARLSDEGGRVLSRALAANPAAVGLALSDAISNTQDDAVLATCFLPHHQVIVRAGDDRVTASVCFMCGRVAIAVDGYDTSFQWALGVHRRDLDAREAIFDALFTESGLPSTRRRRSH